MVKSMAGMAKKGVKKNKEKNNKSNSGSNKKKVHSLALAPKGAEDIAAIEIAELIHADNIIASERAVCFDAEPLDLARLCYSSQSLGRVIELIFACKFDDFDGLSNQIEKKLQTFSLLPFILKNQEFLVECKRIGSHSFNSQDIEKKISGIIAKKGYSFDFKSPDVIFFAFIRNNEFFLGVDYGGMELDKREYRIFTHPADIKATIGYALLRIAGYSGKEFLIDPFCLSGTILIEASLFASHHPVNYFRKDALAFQKIAKFSGVNFSKFFSSIDSLEKKNKLALYGYSPSLRDLINARKNAKIAGIDKLLNLSKVDVEWLDIKFKKHTADIIVTYMPILKFDMKKTEKLFKEFFYQAEYILKKECCIAVISRSREMLEKYANEYSFKIVSERSIYSGEQEHRAYVLKRKI